MTTESQGNVQQEDPKQRAWKGGAGARSWMLSAVLLLAGTLAILTGCGGGSGSGHSPPDTGAPSWSPDGRQFAFASDHDGEFEIYVVARHGGRARRLTDNDDEDSLPSWSPDGRRIAFVSDREGGFELYVMNADGSDETRLTTTDVGDIAPPDVGDAAVEDERVAVERLPAWSPDGRQIAFTVSDCKQYAGFVSVKLDCTTQIFAIGADGSRQKRLGRANESDPAWSKSGLLAVSDGGGLVLYRDGRRRLVRKNLGASGPSWSPDGQWIAYGDGDGFGLNVIRANGTGWRSLTSLEDWDVGDPAWSPDGRTIVFEGSHTPQPCWGGVPSTPGRPACTTVSFFFTIRPNGTGLRKLRLDWR